MSLDIILYSNHELMDWMISQSKLLNENGILTNVQWLRILIIYLIVTVRSLKMLMMSVDSITPAPPSPFFFLGPRMEDSSWFLKDEYLIERSSSDELSESKHWFGCDN